MGVGVFMLREPVQRQDNGCFMFHCTHAYSTGSHRRETIVMLEIRGFLIDVTEMLKQFPEDMNDVVTGNKGCQTESFFKHLFMFSSSRV